MKKEVDDITSSIINDFLEERKGMVKKMMPSFVTMSSIEVTSTKKSEVVSSNSKDPQTQNTLSKTKASSSEDNDHDMKEGSEESGSEPSEESEPSELSERSPSPETTEISRVRVSMKLPPRGTYIFPDIKVGDAVLAAESGTSESLWTNAIVKSVIEPKDTSLDPETRKRKRQYKVSFLSGPKKDMMMSSSRIADLSPPEVMVRVGCHVVAYSFSGMVAETTKITNGGNYLIFFEKGDAMYVSPTEISVCGDQKFEPDKKFLKPDYYEFLVSYMKTFPEKKMLKLTKGGEIDMKSLTTGKWIRGVVKEVLYSLVRVYFSTSDHEEWVYRGSHRLRPLVNAYTPLTQQPRLPSPTSMSRRLPVRSTGTIILKKMQQNKADPAILQYVVDPDDQKEKSITGTTDVLTEHKGHLLISFLKHAEFPKKDLIPFKPHLCSESCNKYKLDIKTVRGHNPFIWPLLSGWSRFIFVIETGKFGIAKKEVLYMTPCKRILRNIDEVRRYLTLTENKIFPFLGVEFFTFEKEFELFRQTTAVVHQCVNFVEDISNGEEKQPISNINFLDNEVIDPEFKYCSTRFPAEGVDLNLDPRFLVCCDCEDDCETSPNCSCTQLTKQGFDIIQGMSDVYPVKGYKNKRLDEVVPFGIYECNSNCRCKSSCGNRVVQNGITVLLQVFKTSQKGWGTRVLHDVPKGTFIASYSACLFNEDHADDNAVQTGDEYFANLDFIECAERNKREYEEAPIVDLPDEDEDDDDDWNEFTSNRKQFQFCNSSRGLRNQSEKEKPPPATVTQTSQRLSHRQAFYGTDVSYILDAKKKGNVGRFFNHSCSPNCFPQNVFTDTHDMRFPIIAFFALRTIYALEEISWDYNYEIGSVPDRKMYCHCKSSNCRGRLL
jgi:histone-lysine N-methyltransferase SETDB1